MSLVNLTTGKELLDRYKETRPTLLQTGLSIDILTLSETFSKGDLDEIFKQNGCEKFRVYFGMNTDDTIGLVITGVDSTGRDILPPGSEIIAISDSKCPPDCPLPSPINP